MIFSKMRGRNGKSILLLISFDESHTTDSNDSKAINNRWRDDDDKDDL